MHSRYLDVTGFLTAGAVCLLAAVPVEGQVFTTPWGDPDLQGTWTNQTLTPLERPAEFEGKPTLTEAETLEWEARLREGVNTDIRTPGTLQDVTAAYNTIWYDRGERIVADRRTSLVIDSADGKVPELTPAGAVRKVELREADLQEDLGTAGSWEDFSAYVRCIIRSGLPRLSTGYNNNYEIVQTPGLVAIYQEQMHDIRLIPLDGRPHLPGTVRQWLGDSRGHWEGDTLVVETTNFTDQARGSLFLEATKDMVLVERFTRAGADMIDYRFTITDPAIWTSSWTAALPWNREEGLIYEYACHEGNHGLENSLSAARAADEAEAQEQP
jgi:hypothetical protein